MRKKYIHGDIVGPYTLIESINKDRWKCKCNLCNSIVDVFTDNLKRSTMCRNCRSENNKKPRENLIGKKFNKLLVLEYVGNSRWKCLCECGKEVIVLTSHLKSGHTKSCGCLLKEVNNNNFLKDLTGQRFYKLTVRKRIEDYISPKGKHVIQYECICDCGQIINVLGNNLIKGNTMSCGCINESHGEYLISSFFVENNIIYKKQYTFSNLRTNKFGILRFDFAIFKNENELSFLLEFQGVQHFKERKDNPEFGKLQREVTDKLKEEYCKENNIKLYKINYNENIEKKLEKIFNEI